jgi:hypothetical protein
MNSRKQEFLCIAADLSKWSPSSSQESNGHLINSCFQEFMMKVAQTEEVSDSTASGTG